MMTTWRRALHGKGRRRLAGGSARRRVMVVVAAGAAAVCAGLLTGAGSAPAAAARAGAPGVRWGTAVEVPGLAALDAGASAEVSSVSCASAGNCAAGGRYGQVSGGSQAFVVSETHGVWRTAREVPLPSTSGGSAAVTSVSCPSAGNCTAGGYYPIPAGPFAVPGSNSQGFVVSETHGVWGTPQVPPGLAALNVGDFATVSSVSCASAGNCGAAGSWTSEDDRTDDNPGLPNPFVAAEKNGHWGTVHVPSSAKLQLYQSEQIWANAVSCPSAGNCTAVGTAAGFGAWGFVVREVHGTWGTAAALRAPTTPR